MKRRNFIKNTALLTGGVTILNFPVFGKKAPSNKIVIGVMGLNSRGNYLASSFAKLPNVEVGYLCDVEEGADNASGNFVKVVQRLPVKIEFLNPADSLVKKLRPGMNVDVDVNL